MQIETSTRHGSPEPNQHAYLPEKAETLVKDSERLMAIGVAVDHARNARGVEIRVSAEHKRDFFAAEAGPSPEVATDQGVHKVGPQLRRYEVKVQQHRDAIPQGGTSPTRPDLPGPSGSA